MPGPHGIYEEEDFRVARAVGETVLSLGGFMIPDSGELNSPCVSRPVPKCWDDDVDDDATMSLLSSANTNPKL